MRDIQRVLEHWGAWAADGAIHCKWPRASVLAKVASASSGKMQPSCGDGDGAKIDRAIRRLKDYKKDYYSLIIMYYLKRYSPQKIADHYGVSRDKVVKRLQAAEGFIEGCLVMSDVKLEIDRFVREERNALH